MADETLPAPAREAAEAAYRNWRIGDDGEGRLHAALVAAAPLIRAAERERAEAAESERDRFREQARILGDERSEWACDRCDVIHPWRDGDRFTAACPDCGTPMLPTSLSSRLLANARARAEAAETKLAEVRAFLDRASIEFNERNQVTREVPAGTPVMVRALDIAAIIGSGEDPS